MGIKIHHSMLVKVIGFAGAYVLRAWLGTLRYQYRYLGDSVDPHDRALVGRYIYAMWHETLLLPLQRYARPDICVLISKHGDGGLLAEVCRWLRVAAVRGSTTRGGAEALRRLLREGERRHLALTPDGPRGPRRRVKPGVIYLSARLGLPIVPVGFGLRRPRRLQSWDRFILPRPWSRARCVTGNPIFIAPNPTPEQLELHRQYVEEVLELVTQAAEDWAETGVWNPPVLPVLNERAGVRELIRSKTETLAADAPIAAAG